MNLISFNEFFTSPTFPLFNNACILGDNMIATLCVGKCKKKKFVDLNFHFHFFSLYIRLPPPNARNGFTCCFQGFHTSCETLKSDKQRRLEYK